MHHLICLYINPIIIYICEEKKKC
uniref:Uncharacterized protein n=1 Tax=Rhizophora mucronata TaxID=61149 RepID=A0A2P2P262_RHIMU